MKISICAAALCLLWAMALPAPAAPRAASQNRPASGSILDKEQAKEAVRQCSRDTPRNIEDFWIPTKSDIQRMEQHIDQLIALESAQCCGRGKIPGQLSDYDIQYAGIVIGGHRLIYLNAMPAGFVRTGSAHPQKADHVVLVCDGGPAFWGAVYDLETQTFRDLAFNGIA